mmetsp:Transcript_19093/g.35211  ORF Transcript_19093/g.35211 Transcript_19093/m.35211 type:complete len:98 (+) Transcript_19093:48-341(+)
MHAVQQKDPCHVHMTVQKTPRGTWIVASTPKNNDGPVSVKNLLSELSFCTQRNRDCVLEDSLKYINVQMDELKPTFQALHLLSGFAFLAGALSAECP